MLTYLCVSRTRYLHEIVRSLDSLFYCEFCLLMYFVKKSHVFHYYMHILIFCPYLMIFCHFDQMNDNIMFFISIESIILH